jgi:hypothetical protein
MWKGLPLAFLLVALMTFSGCSWGDDDSSGGSGDDATQESLREAYAALESAAEEVPEARLPPFRGETVVLERSEDLEMNGPARPQDSALIDYFAQRRITFGVALIRDEEQRGLALSGIELDDAPGAITLIIPREQRTGSPRDLLDASATFAAMAPSGEIYCIDDAESGVKRCPPADIP